MIKTWPTKWVCRIIILLRWFNLHACLYICNILSIRKSVILSRQSQREQRVFFTIIEQTNASQTHPVLQIVFKPETTGWCCKRQSNTKARNEVFNDAIICIGARCWETRPILTSVFGYKVSLYSSNSCCVNFCAKYRATTRSRSVLFAPPKHSKPPFVNLPFNDALLFMDC